MAVVAGRTQRHFNISTDEKEQLLLELNSRGCRPIEQGGHPGPQQYSATSWNPDPLDPCSTDLWIVEIGPERE